MMKPKLKVAGINGRSPSLFCRIMYRELKDSDKEKESRKMVINKFHTSPPSLSPAHLKKNLCCECFVAVFNV